MVLHGRGDDAGRSVTLLRLHEHLAAAARSGVPPFVLAAVDGGETYRHRRASGDDPERMIFEEVGPRLAGMGLRISRLALMGWSMGGYGALLLARRHPERVVAVAASSPALWHSFGASAPGAFDAASDFAAHRVLGTPPAPGVAYRIDCGEADPFSAVSRQAARELRNPPPTSGGPVCHLAGAGCRLRPSRGSARPAPGWRRARPRWSTSRGRAAAPWGIAGHTQAGSTSTPAAASGSSSPPATRPPGRKPPRPR